MFNPGASMSVGWWLIRTAAVVEVGDHVLVEWLPAAATFARERRHLPTGEPLLKRFSALAARPVSVRRGALVIDGVLLAGALTHDGAQNAMLVWAQCRTFTHDEVFLLNPHRMGSFNSRYCDASPARCFARRRAAAVHLVCAMNMCCGGVRNCAACTQLRDLAAFPMHTIRPAFSTSREGNPEGKI